MLTAQKARKIVRDYEWVKARTHKKECKKKLKMIFNNIETAAKKGKTYLILTTPHAHDPISVDELEKIFTDLGYKFEFSRYDLVCKISWGEEE